MIVFLCSCNVGWQPSLVLKRFDPIVFRCNATWTIHCCGVSRPEKQNLCNFFIFYNMEPLQFVVGLFLLDSTDTRFKKN